MLNFASIPKYCINLKRRPDRKESAQEQFAKIGIEVEFVDAVDAKTTPITMTGHYANILSQLSIIEKATAEYIFICEDDIKFCDDFWLRMKYIERSNIEFDLFYVGGWHMDMTGLEQIDPYLYKVTRMAGSHGIILRNTTYQFITETIKDQYGMDQYLSDVLLKKFRGLAFIPVLAGTIDSFSDIADGNRDYNQSFKNYQQEAVFYE